MPLDPEIDWHKLTVDGRELEQLTRDLLSSLGYRSAWSGQGPDGGRDLTAEEPGAADFGGFTRKWLVSCKHNAVSGKAVSYDDIGDVPGRLTQHGCHGFLLVCTTHPSSGLVDAFQGWKDNTSYLFHCWDEPTLRLLLRRPEATQVRTTYFPNIASAAVTSTGRDSLGAPTSTPDFSELRSTATAQQRLSYIEGPGIAFYFETRGREGSDDGLSHGDAFALAWEHLLAELPHLQWAIRGVFYDDKHSSYSWRVDVIPTSSEQYPDARVLQERLSRVLVRSGRWGGQWHDFEIRRQRQGVLSLITPRSANEADLSLLIGWEDRLQ
ncbi:MAG: restriction endonuclease [Solirubrobacteraceae bacterium]